MRAKLIILSAALVLAAAEQSPGQQPAGGPESHKYRAILTIAGGGGGFALGVFAGIAAFDDSTYASRKVTTTAVAAAAAGAVGGYLIGRALDKRGKGKTIPRMPLRRLDELDRSLTRAQQPAALAACLGAPLRVPGLSVPCPGGLEVEHRR